jgi:serine/threonine-protein kinase
MYAVPFDPVRLEVHGTPVVVLEDVASNPTWGSAQFSFTETGTLVYTSGRSGSTNWPLAWLDSSGAMKLLLATPGAYFFPNFSPDGNRLVMQGSTGAGTDIFIYDWQRNATMRLTSVGGANGAVWSVDGKFILFGSTGAGSKPFFGISAVRSDGATEPQQVIPSKTALTVPWSISGDGKHIAYHVLDPETQGDIWTASLDSSDPAHLKTGMPTPFIHTAATELCPSFSPDGHWIAYRSNESGRNEIYVRPFPGPGGKAQISTDGALYAWWSRNGRELFFESSDFEIMSVDYKAEGDTFLPGRPRVWSDRRLIYPGVLNAALHPDGKRFAILEPPDSNVDRKSSVHVTFLLNFFDELRRKVPTGK